MLYSCIASVQTFIEYVAKYGDVCTKTRPEYTLFGYLRKGLFQEIADLWCLSEVCFGT